MSAPTANDLTGNTYGRLTVLGSAPPRARRGTNKTYRMEHCRCTCGTETIVYRTNLTRGYSTSCGCLTRERSIEAHRSMRREWATYSAAHSRVRCLHGPADAFVCPCGTQAAEWAYDHSDPAPLFGRHGSSPTLAYSLDPSRYAAMCRPCHRDLDKQMRGRAHAVSN